MNYQAKLKAPFGILGIRCTADALTGIDFLPASEQPQAPTNAFAAKVCEQLLHYFNDPHSRFTLPLELHGTAHREKVWHAMLDIPCGQTRSYGELATELHSAAQAVGQACGANPIPIVVPCHRVVGKAGLGGFMQHAEGDALGIKRWLLKHEGARFS
ncbi:MAG: cysteine methyltransferase [Gallionellales bacterium GWA2_60_142]|nr:MAG: cysteine methyltransferase [Gallionellales bacterium GWA2_60_142]HCI14052.1 cysteine methyltransferase [Gallionellaceae bacterium]